MTAEGEHMQQVAAALTTALPGPERGAFEAWLHRALSEQFDSTLDETLPADLTGLLNGLH